MTDARSVLIVVDAANVVGSRPDGWWRDRGGAARRLLVNLARWQERLDEPPEVIAVLEGAARVAVADEAKVNSQQLRVVRADESGDDAIVGIVAEAVETNSDRPVRVVTADRGLRSRVEALGAGTVGPRWLLDRIESPGEQ